MEPENDQPVFYLREITQVLFGLMHVYHSKPWYSRWLFKPWLDALNTAALILGGNEMVKELERRQVLDQAQDILDND